MSTLWSLPPFQRTAFATASRLLSCLITESLLEALFVPVSLSNAPNDLIGLAIVLASGTSSHNVPFRLSDVFAVVPLREVPVFKANTKDDIGLLDPLDMLPYIYELPGSNAELQVQNGHAGNIVECDELRAAILSTLSSICCDVTGSTALTPSLDPLRLWKKFADGLNVAQDMQDAVAAELSSSLAWQQYSYEKPPPQPSFDSPSIAWEQSIVEGHPTHPMHKARRTIEPILPLTPGDYDWQHPRIRLVAVPRESMKIQGAWDDLLAPLRASATTHAGKPLNVPDDHVLVPIHELQVPNIQAKFPEAYALPPEYSVDAQAQQSIRTVILPSVLRPLCLKLALGVRLTSAMRTISPMSAFLGPRFSSGIVPLLTYDRSLLIVQHELASVSHVNPDPEVAKHLAGIVREAYENISVEEKGERVIVCTSLTEMGYGGKAEVPLVQIAFGLDTEEKRIAWLDRFVDLYLKAFLPSVLANGVAFEAHPQNTLARFDMQTRQLTGFVIRDFGGLRVHPPTLLSSTGLRSLDEYISPGHSIIADTLEDVHTRLYHTLIHNHLQQLIRVLKLHYNGRGWAIVRRHLSQQIPDGHELKKLWLNPATETLPGKCFLRMRLQGMYRTHLHSPFPNLIHYRGTQVAANTVM